MSETTPSKQRATWMAETKIGSPVLGVVGANAPHLYAPTWGAIGQEVQLRRYEQKAEEIGWQTAQHAKYLFCGHLNETTIFAPSDGSITVQFLWNPSEPSRYLKAVNNERVDRYSGTFRRQDWHPVVYKYEDIHKDLAKHCAISSTAAALAVDESEGLALGWFYAKTGVDRIMCHERTWPIEEGTSLAEARVAEYRRLNELPFWSVYS